MWVSKEAELLLLANNNKKKNTKNQEIDSTKNA